jgi:hypothetical protein
MRRIYSTHENRQHEGEEDQVQSGSLEQARRLFCLSLVRRQPTSTFVLDLFCIVLVLLVKRSMDMIVV